MKKCEKKLPIYSAAGLEKTKNVEGLWLFGVKVLLQIEASLLVSGRSVEWVCAINEVTRGEVYIIYENLKLSPNAKELLGYWRTVVSSTL